MRIPSRPKGVLPSSGFCSDKSKKKNYLDSLFQNRLKILTYFRIYLLASHLFPAENRRQEFEGPPLWAY